MALSGETVRAKDDPAEGILLYDGKRYAVDLMWLTSDGDLTQNLAVERAKKLRADFYCIRSNVVNQQGFGYLEKGHRMGMPSAASLAADSLVGEWHGVFAADNGWWYLAVHSDAVAPDGDRMFFSEEDAYNHYIQKAQEYKWPRSYAPAAWNLPDTTGEMLLPRLLESGGATTLKPCNLNAMFGGANRKRIAIASGGVFLILAFSLALLPLLGSKIEGAQQGTMTVSVLAPEIIKPPPPEPERFDLSQQVNLMSLRLPLPSGVIGRCAAAFESIVHPLPGWTLTNVTCNTMQVEANWKKANGSLEMLKSSLSGFPKETVMKYTGSDKFVASLPIKNVSDLNTSLQVLDRDKAILTLNDRFGGLGSMSIKYVSPPPPKQAKTPSRRNARGAPAIAPETPPVKPPYLEFTLTTDTPPNILASYFDVPGLSLQNMNWNLVNKIWSYQAEILINSEQLRYGLKTK